MRLRSALIPFVLLASCASQSPFIPGTRVPDEKGNRDIIRAVEQYRLAMERKDTAALMEMASKSYWEDGGTPTGADDYGYDGLRDVLKTRFQRVDGIRYSVKYVSVERKDRKAFVSVLIDASYSIETPRGIERKDMKDQNQIVLENDGQGWRIVSGM